MNILNANNDKKQPANLLLTVSIHNDITIIQSSSSIELLTILSSSNELLIS